jgi:2-polyprenyl-6-methoxyphenol hydroxylase-like FAD-dependent oxidoreductase
MTGTSTTASDYDVVILGGGPVGKMAALMLGRRGHSVLVCERKEVPYPLPRAVAHDAEIARIFQNVGMPVDSMPDAVEPYDDLYVWVNGDDETLHLVDWRGIDPSGWHNTYFYNQPAMERHLAAKLDETGTVTTRRGVIARVAGHDDQGVDVELTGSDGVSTVRARYAIGADGANSGVRADLGIEWSDLGYFFDWLVIDVVPKPGLVVTTLAKQVADPARPTTVVPGGPGRRRWEFMRLDGETVEELTAPAKIWQLLEPFGVTPETAELERGVSTRSRPGGPGSGRADGCCSRATRRTSCRRSPGRVSPRASAIA